MQDISFSPRESEENKGIPLTGKEEFSVLPSTQSTGPGDVVSVPPVPTVAMMTNVSTSTESKVSPEGAVSPLSDMTMREVVFSNNGEDVEKKKKKLMRLLWWGIGMAGVVFIGISGAIWGYGRYEKTYGTVSVEKMFPKEVDLAIRVSVQADSPQVKLLQATMQKFPGYDYAQKSFDAAGEGKGGDQSFLDEWKKLGVSFDDDVLPVLGDSAWVVIPDLHPVEQMVGKELGEAFPKADALLASANEDAASPRVLGEQTQVPALDFLSGVPITDLKKAFSVIEKLQKGSDRYQATNRTYKGYEYIELFDTAYEAKGNEGELRPNAVRTFHALLGNNWVTASRDDWMRDMIDRRDALLAFSFFRGEDSPDALESNQNMQRVMNSLRAEENNLVSVYYKVNMKNGCTEGDFCSYGVKDWGDREGGFSLRLNGDGVLARFMQLSGDKDFLQEKNAYESGLAAQIPKNPNGKWADVMLEVTDLKGAYYDFKKNYLTEKGLAEWDADLESDARVLGVHMERDIMDNAAGSAGVVLLTSKSAFPDAFVLAHLANGKGEEMLRRYFGKMVEEENGAIAQRQEMCKKPEYKTYCQKMSIASISAVEETKTDFGMTIHIKKSANNASAFLGGSFDVCGGVGKDGLTILGTSCSGVGAILGFPGLSDGTQKMLSQNNEYRFAQQYVGNEGLSRVHVVPLGFLYAVTRIVDEMAGFFENTSLKDDTFSQNAERQQERMTTLAGLEGIFKTVPSVTVQGDSTESSTMFMHIKELPKEEKKKADINVAAMMSGVKKAQSNAESASFKSYVNALVPSMIICCDASGTKLETEVGKTICQEGVNQRLYSARELSVDSVVYQVKKGCGANGSFEYEIHTSGNGVCSGITAITMDGVTFPEGC